MRDSAEVLSLCQGIPRNACVVGFLYPQIRVGRCILGSSNSHPRDSMLLRISISSIQKCSFCTFGSLDFSQRSLIFHSEGFIDTTIAKRKKSKDPRIPVTTSVRILRRRTPSCQMGGIIYIHICLEECRIVFHCCYCVIVGCIMCYVVLQRVMDTRFLLRTDPSFPV